MANKTKKKASPAKKQPSNLQKHKGYILWLGVIIFVSAWMFLLGVLVGRGTAPVKFDMAKLQKELGALREAVLKKDQEKLERNSGKVRFPEALKETPRPPRIKKPIPFDQLKQKKKPLIEKPAENKKPIEKEAAPVAEAAAADRDLTIQVAALKESKLADKMIDTLQQKGYPAYKSIAEIPNKGIWYRVRIGSFRDKEDAQEILARLKKDNLQGILVKK